MHMYICVYMYTHGELHDDTIYYQTMWCSLLWYNLIWYDLICFYVCIYIYIQNINLIQYDRVLYVLIEYYCIMIYIDVISYIGMADNIM